ncbi:hypothetical protein B0O99DRAFT_718309 [Bisporella sp. PMI_857]|nr:hypothetical protein B0O99DRAFT_718309 [Bisporella sp. PMI_857]
MDDFLETSCFAIASFRRSAIGSVPRTEPAPLLQPTAAGSGRWYPQKRDQHHLYRAVSSLQFCAGSLLPTIAVFSHQNLEIQGHAIREEETSHSWPCFAAFLSRRFTTTTLPFSATNDSDVRLCLSLESGLAPWFIRSSTTVSCPSPAASDSGVRPSSSSESSFTRQNTSFRKEESHYCLVPADRCPPLMIAESFH